MPETTCLVCGHLGFEPHLEILLRCRACGFVTARVHGSFDARGLYDGDYFTGAEYLDYPADEALFRKTFRRRLEHMLRHKPGGRLLEIGSAYGFFLDLARARFDVVGFELNREAARHGRERFGLDIRTDDFLQAGLDDVGGSFDVVAMWDVIEHLERPDLFVAHAAGLCRPGALLCLTTGDIGSFMARARGRKWRLIHPPSHLHYFDRQTIARLLERHGFRVIDTRAVGVARSWRQVLYSVFALGLKMPRAYAAMARAVPASWGFTLNTFDIMQVTARRQD